MPRFIEITTPLEKDVLLFHKMHGTEEISRLFEYELDLLSSDGEVDLDEVLGKSITITLERVDGEVRHFNGLCSRISQGGREGRYYVYHARVRPWLWFLTRTRNYRIFQEKSVPDILKEMFDQHSAIANVEFQLMESYAPWTYCVQYNESDFAFVSRLMEHEGIYYYFKHTDGKHALVVADSYSAHSATYEDEIPFIPPQERVRPEREHISEWTISREVRPGKYALAAYDFEKPSVDLQVRSSVKRSHALAEYEVFEYHWDYIDRNDGETYARTRIEEQQAKYERARGTTNARAMVPGDLFKLGSHPRSDQNAEYLTVSAEYDLQSGQYEGRDTVPAEYSCKFTALNSQHPFRAERLTPKPIVYGPQTALVVGPSGEDIYTDKFGRVKVHFYWDRLGKREDGDSCWIRVSQNWGGKGWGGMFIPHVGQEVIVMFEGGDPDLPLITGRVYNAEQMPPIDLPGGKTKSIIRDHGGNEIIMEGAAGGQQMRLHSPTHQTTMTLGNSWITGTLSYAKQTIGDFIEWAVGTDWIAVIKGNQKWDVFGSKTTRVLGNNSKQVIGFEMTSITGLKTERNLGGEVKFIGGIKNETVVGAEIKTNVVNKTEFIKGSTVKLHSGKEYKHEKSGKGEKSAGLIQMAKDVKQFRDAEKKIVKANKILKVAGKKHDKADKMIWDAIDVQHNSYNLKEIAKAERKEKQATKTVKTTGNQLEKAAQMKFQASQIMAKGTVKLG